MSFDYKPHKKSNISTDWGEVYENNQVRDSILEQQRLEEEERRKKQENNLVMEVLDIQNTGQYASQGFQQGILEGDVGKAFSNAGKGLVAGLTPWMDDARFEASQTRKIAEENGIQIGFSDTYDSWGESWQGFKDAKDGSALKAMRSFANGTLEFAWDVATDPLTYATFGASGLIKGGKKISTEIGEEALKEITERTMKEGVGEIAEKRLTKFTEKNLAEYVEKGIPEDIARNHLTGKIKKYESDVLTELQEKYSKVYKTDEKTVQYYMNKLDKVGGTSGRRGINIFGAQFTDGSLMEKIGDATIAPYYHKAMNALSESKIGKMFNHSPGLRKLAHESPELAYKQIRAIDDFARLKQLGMNDTDELSKVLGNLLEPFTEAQRVQIMDIIERGETITGTKKDYVRWTGRKAFNDEYLNKKEANKLAVDNTVVANDVTSKLEPLLKGDVVKNIMSSDDATKQMVKELLDPYDQFNTFDEVIKARGKNIAPDMKNMKERIVINEVLNGTIQEEDIARRIDEVLELDEVSTRNLLRDRLTTDNIDTVAFDTITNKPDFNTLDNETLSQLINKETEELILQDPIQRAKRGQKQLKDNTRKQFELAYGNERQKFSDDLTYELNTAQTLYKKDLENLPTITAYQKILDDEQFVKDMIEYKAVGIDGLDSGFTRVVRRDEGIFLEKTKNWSYMVDGKKIKITDEMARATHEIQKILRDMGMKEMEIGLLDKHMKNYAPHYLNPEALNNKKVMEALRSGDPELYQKAISGSGLFNQSDMERGLSKGRTVQEVNELIKPLLEKAGFDGDLYINNVYDAVMARGRQHNNIMYGGEYGDSMLAQFGIRIKPDMMNSKERYYISQTDFSKIFRKTDPKTVGAYMGDLNKYRGKTIIQLTADEYKSIAELYNKNVVHNMGKGVGLNAQLPVYELPQYIAYSVQKVGEVAQMKEASALLKMYDKFTNVFKVGATASRLGFHANNAKGNIFNTWLNMGVKTLDSDVQKAKLEIMGALKGGKVGDVPTPLTSTIKTPDGEIPLQDVLNYWEIKKGVSRIDDIYGTVKEGTFRDTLKGATLNPFNFKDNAWLRVSGQIGDTIETSSRLDILLASLKEGKTIDEALEISDKVLFDYGDLTDFERNVMRRAIPFYTFMSKNMGFLLDEMMQHPTRFRMFLNGYLDATKDNSMFISEYAHDWLTTGEYVDEDGNTIVQKSSANLPIDQLLNPSSLVDSLSPVIKLPFELLANKKTFNGDNISSSYDTTAEQLMDKGDYIVDTMFPILKASKKLLGINDTKNIIEDGSLFKERDDERKRRDTVSWFTGINTVDFNTTKAEKNAIEKAIRSIEKAKRDAEQAKNPKEKKSKEQLQKEKLEQYGF